MTRRCISKPLWCLLKRGPKSGTVEAYEVWFSTKGKGVELYGSKDCALTAKKIFDDPGEPVKVILQEVK